MSSPKVLIVGCGVAGPVVACLLKRKGYDPIIFEKVVRLGDAGASVMLMPNGMNVLRLIGVADAVAAESDPLRYFVERTAAGELLAESGLASSFAVKYGEPAAGIKRATLNLMLKKTLLDKKVELREGWTLVDIREGELDVTAIFDNGESITGSFLIGCDGLKSAARLFLQAKKGISQLPPIYTGLVQVAGISKTPRPFVGNPALRNWYGQGLHFIAYPISPSHTSWAATMPEERGGEETWRLYSASEVETQTKMLAAMLQDGWDSVVHDLTLSAERIVKFGIFDREELQPADWYSKRCVLIGDAAHPTSPHLGQGANQALEDGYNLCRAMPFLDPQSSELEESLSTLGILLSETYFCPLAGERQPRTSTLVKAARAIGELRVANDPETCKRRDAAIASGWKAGQKMEAKYRELFTSTFPILEYE